MLREKKADVAGAVDGRLKVKQQSKLRCMEVLVISGTHATFPSMPSQRAAATGHAAVPLASFQ